MRTKELKELYKFEDYPDFKSTLKDYKNNLNKPNDGDVFNSGICLYMRQRFDHNYRNTDKILRTVIRYYTYISPIDGSTPERVKALKLVVRNYRKLYPIKCFLHDCGIKIKIKLT